jgi:hypothetical protein
MVDVVLKSEAETGELIGIQGKGFGSLAKKLDSKTSGGAGEAVSLRKILRPEDRFGHNYLLRRGNRGNPTLSF